MIPALLNEKVVFLKNTVITDAVGNHTNEWDEYYTCFATIGGEGMASSKEEEVAGTVFAERLRDGAADIRVEVHRVDDVDGGIPFRQPQTVQDHIFIKIRLLRIGTPRPGIAGELYSGSRRGRRTRPGEAEHHTENRGQ